VCVCVCVCKAELDALQNPYCCRESNIDSSTFKPITNLEFRSSSLYSPLISFFNHCQIQQSLVVVVRNILRSESP